MMKTLIEWTKAENGSFIGLHPSGQQYVLALRDGGDETYNVYARDHAGSRTLISERRYLPGATRDAEQHAVSLEAGPERAPFWTIEMPPERGGGGCTHWWHPSRGWVSDVNEACQFARRQDAEDTKQACCSAAEVVTEHRWVMPRPQDLQAAARVMGAARTYLDWWDNPVTSKYVPGIALDDLRTAVAAFEPPVREDLATPSSGDATPSIRTIDTTEEYPEPLIPEVETYLAKLSVDFDDGDDVGTSREDCDVIVTLRFRDIGHHMSPQQAWDIRGAVLTAFGVIAAVVRDPTWRGPGHY